MGNTSKVDPLLSILIEELLSAFTMIKTKAFAFNVSFIMVVGA